MKSNQIEKEFVTKSNKNSLDMLEAKIGQALNSIEPSDEFNQKMLKQFSKNSASKFNLLDFIMMRKYIFTAAALAIMALIFAIGIYAWTNSKLGLNPKTEIADNKKKTEETIKKENSVEKKDQNPQELNYQKVDTSGWKTLRLKYDPEDAMDIKVPSDWVLHEYDNGNTHAILAPSGSAWGYDFFIPTSLIDCSGKNLVKINDNYSRFFDDQSNAGTNWYVCEMIDGKMQQHFGQSFSFYAKSEGDLMILDAIMASFVKIHQPGVSAGATGTVTTASTVYTDSVIGFKVTIPAGWEITNSPYMGDFFKTVLHKEGTNVEIIFQSDYTDPGASAAQNGPSNPYTMDRTVKTAYGDILFKEGGAIINGTKFFDIARNVVPMNNMMPVITKDNKRIYISYDSRSDGKKNYSGNFENDILPLLSTFDLL